MRWIIERLELDMYSNMLEQGQGENTELMASWLMQTTSITKRAITSYLSHPLMRSLIRD
jgi:hypothetical protein